MYILYYIVYIISHYPGFSLASTTGLFDGRGLGVVMVHIKEILVFNAKGATVLKGPGENTVTLHILFNLQ